MTAPRAPVLWSHQATRSRITIPHHTPNPMVCRLVRDSWHRRADHLHPGQAPGIVPAAPARAVPAPVHRARCARLGDRCAAATAPADRNPGAAVGDWLLRVGADRYGGAVA